MPSVLFLVIGYARNKKLDNDFNLPGHGTHHMKFIIIDKVKYIDTQYRKEREKNHINKFNTHREGLNEKP